LTQNIDFWAAVQKIRELDDSYAPEAYAFVMEALEYTLQKAGERRHVSAAELIEGCASYARGRYGLLAYDVLHKWNVAGPDDIGELVFQMIDAGVLSRQDSDHREDFDIEYDLKTALEEGYFE
jgi:uncharacterized repeat protein (TIGR04138 family)